MPTHYCRILLKLGGEALSDPGKTGINPSLAEEVVAKVQAVKNLGIEVAMVIGGGNLWRGREGIERGMERATADYIGMLGTVMNALALQDALERSGVMTRVQTAIEMRAVAEPYIRRRAMRHLEKGRVVIFAAGTGNPFFTTDTAAALRATEIDAEVMVKATKVDGVYDDDPYTNPQARKFQTLTFIEALNRQLKVIDSTSLSLCMDNNLPILVLNLWQNDDLIRAMQGDPTVGTIIRR
jgi:uridylate kinase